MNTILTINGIKVFFKCFAKVRIFIDENKLVYFAVRSKLSEAELMQYLRPVGLGPSSKI